MTKFTGVKLFSATKHGDREVLGEKITEWIRANPRVEIVDKTITQSSDEQFHCIAITLFYTGELEAATVPASGPSSGGAPARRLSFKEG